MLRLAIRYMGRDKDDTVTVTVNEDIAAKFRTELADVNNALVFVTIDAPDKTIILRRESIVTVIIARDDRER
jgi:hypothetical protein